MEEVGGDRPPGILRANGEDRRRQSGGGLPRRVKCGWGPSHRDELDGMGWDACFPSEGVPLNDGGESPISEQEIDTAGADRSATYAGGFGANVSPLGSNKGVQAMELLEFHVEIAANEARDPPGSLRIH
jgi:hypothetical protein